MATVKIKTPPEVGDNAEQDIQNLRGYLFYLSSQLNYILNNLDSDNIIQEEK